MFGIKKKIESMSLKDVTTLLDGLRIPISLVFTPTNLELEKKKFFDSDTYEPQFKYRMIKNRNREILSELSNVREISDVDPRISSFYIELINSKKDACDLLTSVGDSENITNISVKKYGRPSPKLYRNACRVLRGRVEKYRAVEFKDDDKKNKMLEYSEIEDVFNEAFGILGLEGWHVNKSINIVKNGAKVGVKRKEVLLDPNIERSVFNLKKTMVHEIGTHAIRAYNGANTGFEALSKANLPSYLDVEEGLATWNESDMGLLTVKTLKEKAAYVYAVYIGESMTFRGLYNSLLGVVPKKTAFKITYRVKRGLEDTSYPGIYTKDIVYFRGLRMVMKRLEKDKSLYSKLYAGKIDFKQCKWVDEGLIPQPLIVPSKEMWSGVFKKVGI